MFTGQEIMGYLGGILLLGFVFVGDITNITLSCMVTLGIVMMVGSTTMTAMTVFWLALTIVSGALMVVYNLVKKKK